MPCIDVCKREKPEREREKESRLERRKGCVFGEVFPLISPTNDNTTHTFPMRQTKGQIKKK